MNKNQATISSENNYTIFKFGEHTIRFRAPYSLERYIEVKEWDDGYLVVMAKYRHNQFEEEEYIDLVPILENLYFDSDKFLKPIKEVRILYEWRIEKNSRWSGYDSDRKLIESGSAKFFVKEDGNTIVENRGILNDRELRKIQAFIKENYNKKRNWYMKLKKVIQNQVWKVDSVSLFCES